ncbi:MAG: twin-arginine translocase subunit TatC [Chloroflexi bacterium HGW-Chloroflexi-6]|nr:MAG: twin-arginine translocase subunit TatC [Chloroflexi bacterium HGW-Chloroflexi-6]
MEKILAAVKWLFITPFRLLFWLVKLPFMLAARFLNWLLRPILEKVKKGKIYLFFNEVPEERPALDAFSDAIENPEEILEQINEIRSHLLRALLALVAAILVSFYFTEQLVAYLALPVGGLEKLQAIEVTESLGVFMRVALLSGVALATPYIAFELWLFAAPGLMPKARLTGLLAIPFALIFFLGGAAFAYYVMLPTALPFLLEFLGIEARLRPESYFTFATGLMFWIGVAFQFPLVIFVLSGMGLVKPRTLLQYWRIALILIAVLSAAITPTIDPVNMALVMLPMTALYFLSIFFSWIANLNKKPEA